MGGGGPAGPPPLPAGGAGAGAGGAVAPCKWELFVKVHSQERFWPKKSFDVQIGPLDAKGKVTAPAQTQTIKMVAKDSPDAHFKGNGTVTYGVTCTAPQIAEEKDWMLARSRTSKQPLDRDRETVRLHDGCLGNRAKRVDLYIRHPLKIYLQLKVKDPDNRLLTFPKDFPVGVYNGKNRLHRLKTDADGKFEFELNRKYDWFTLKFGEDKKLISNGDGTTLKTELKSWNDRAKLEKAAAKFFSPPNRWGLIESVWAFSAKPKFIDGADAYKENEGKIYVFDPPTTNWVRRIGEQGAPIVLTLDPHWQFLRLEYFDRYFGHSDHGHKRTNTPPLFVEGFHRTAKDKTREGGSHWTLQPAHVDNSVHCVPWIRQKDDAGVKKDLPDTKCMLQVDLPANTFVFASDKNTRKIEKVKDSDPRMKAGAERLKLYDLPDMWQSAKYFARYKDAAGKHPGKFYEDWTDADIRKSRTKATPIVFSLDDVVMTDTKFRPLALAAGDRFAFFYHRFKPAYDQTPADVSNEGVYKPDKGTKEPYLSTVLAKGPKNNYVTDYPNWIRLAAGLASVWDIFDKRTVQEVKGARAAVRWFDALKSGKPAGDTNIGWPAPVSKKYYVIQPFFGQKNAHFRMKYVGAGTTPLRDGRFDMVLARCCDRLGADELLMNIQYSRYAFTFLPTSAHAGTPATQKTFKQNVSTNVMARWNGDDGVNPARAELVPQVAAPVKGEVIYFIQGVPNLKSAHCDIQVDALGGGRASMNSIRGRASVDDTSDVPAPGFSNKDFALAHEHGHASSFPDEYSERITYCSHRASGIGYNTPGDQFVSDGFFHDLTASLFGAAHGAATAPIALMAQNNVGRNRYFWHNAEFCRKHVGMAFLAKLGGGLPDYKLPGHPNFPQRNYVYWPMRDALNKTRGAHGKFDVLLHAAGKDHYTVNLLPNPPVDAFLAVVIKIDITFPAVAGMTFGQIRDVIRNEILTTNGKFKATGDATVQTDKGKKAYPIARASLRVSPRFIISNPDGVLANYAADYAAWKKEFGVHFTATVVDNAGKVGPAIVAPAWTAKHKFTMAGDFTKPNINAVLTAQTQQFLQEMLGAIFNAAGVQAADLTDIAKMVIKKNAAVV